MPVIAITPQNHELASRLLKTINAEVPIKIVDACNALMLAIGHVAYASDRPAETIENVIIQLAQFPACKGRAIPEAMFEAMSKIAHASGELS